jgi:hypothetical protein
VRSARSSAVTASGPPRWLARAACLACVALALWAHRRALGMFFSPDDLISLERARGLVPPYPVPFWRVLSGSGYFALASRLFGADPFPYHLVNWLVHGANVALLFALIRRWGGSIGAATLAAALFGTSRLHAAVMLQSVGLEELLALSASLLVFLTLDPNQPRRLWLPSLIFLAALLSKEIVLLLPLLLLFPLPPRAPFRARAVAAGSLLGVAALYLVAFAATRGTLTVASGAAYATRYGANLFHNLMTYSAWVLDFRHAVPDFGAGLSESAWHAGMWLWIAFAVLFANAGRQRLLVGAGAAWFLLMLAPVLPYVWHSVVFYLYPALPGACLALAAGITGAWDRLSESIGSRAPRVAARSAPAASAALLILAIAAHAAVSERLAAERWKVLVPGLTVHLDAVLRKAELARNVSRTLAPSVAGPHARIVFVRPAEAEERRDLRTGRLLATESDAPDLLLSVLDQGRALRALFPGLDSVAFVDRWSPGYRDFDLVVNNADGFTLTLGHGPDAHLNFAGLLLRRGLKGPALEDLAAARQAYPEDPRLAIAYQRVAAQR